MTTPRVFRGPSAILKAFGFRTATVRRGCACRVCAPSKVRIVMNSVSDTMARVARILATSPAPPVPDWRAALRAQHEAEQNPAAHRERTLRAALTPKEVK